MGSNSAEPTRAVELDDVNVQLAAIAHACGIDLGRDTDTVSTIQLRAALALAFKAGIVEAKR